MNKDKEKVRCNYCGKWTEAYIGQPDVFCSQSCWEKDQEDNICQVNYDGRMFDM